MLRTLPATRLQPNVFEPFKPAAHVRKELSKLLSAQPFPIVYCEVFEDRENFPCAAVKIPKTFSLRASAASFTVKRTFLPMFTGHSNAHKKQPRRTMGSNLKINQSLAGAISLSY